MRQLAAVVVADHVVGEHDEALTRQVDRAGRAGRQLGVLQTPVRPMPVRRQNRRKRTGARRPIEIAGDEKAGEALEVHLRDRVIAPACLAEDLRPERRLLGKRHEPRRHQNVVAQVRRAALPVGRRRVLARLQPIVQRAIPGMRLILKGGGRHLSGRANQHRW